jgi:hypothetical protein
MCLCKAYVLISRFSLLFFFSKNIYDYYKRVRTFYICPLGEAKHEVDSLKYKEENLKMLQIIETDEVNLLKGQRKIAEDDEFEYYTEDK